MLLCRLLIHGLDTLTLPGLSQKHYILGSLVAVVGQCTAGSATAVLTSNAPANDRPALVRSAATTPTQRVLGSFNAVRMSTYASAA